MTRSAEGLDLLLGYPLLHALFGRRARRFGLGMEIPSGPLAFQSTKSPVPLSEVERTLLVAAATGVSGWSFGVPFGPRTPDAHAEFTLRFTGRTAPTAAGIGTPALLLTDGEGRYCVRTRDVTPGRMAEPGAGDDDPLGPILAACREATVRIGEGRLDLPSEPPHLLPPNLWWANRPGSTLFFPLVDAAEECLGILALMMRHGVMVVDQDTGEPAGNLEPFVRSGLLDREKRFPLSELQHDVHECACLEAAFMGHNIMLVMQGMGLGGLYFNGLDLLSVLGSNARDGIQGFGFRFVEDDRWVTPNPVGLPGIFESLCPPFYPDMHAAVEAFVARKFGPGGAYDPDTPGPWQDTPGVKRSARRYDRDFVDCLSEVARYIYEKHGKFPGIRSTIVLPGCVQAHHLDTDFYDAHHQDGAYLPTHRDHMERWHPGE
jgi:hypothetical protein